jgi:uncharacterized glyoxalase superfamily protein PhnB
MTDPLARALYSPPPSTDPDPAFAARLRARVERALAPVTALVPYLAVADARAALDWYAAVLGAVVSDRIVMPDGRIGHAELSLGTGVTLYLSDAHPEIGVVAPVAGAAAVTLHLSVADTDALADRAVRAGATLDREPGDTPYGRIAVVTDPFGHRWMLNAPVPRPAGIRGLVLRVPDPERAREFYAAVLGAPYPHPVEPGPAAVLPVLPAGTTGDLGFEYVTGAGSDLGDVAYVTLHVTDSAAARAALTAALGWRFTPGRIADGWGAEGVVPMTGLSGGHPSAAVLPMYRVTDIERAVAAVRAHGGTATDPERQPYGVSAECADDQGVGFYLGEL